MSDQDFAEKTEKPTPKKRQDTRKKGEVAKSRELPSVAVLLAGIMSLAAGGTYMSSQLKTMTGTVIAHIPTADFKVADAMEIGREVVVLFMLTLAPFLAAVFLAAIFSNIVQVGFLVSGESIKPKLSKLSPIKGFTRLFSLQSLMELCKSLLKLAIVGGVGYVVVRGQLNGLGSLVEMEIGAISLYILVTTLKICLVCGLAMTVLVAADFAFQKWQFERRIRMTKQEVKDEMKRTEGDPLIKSRIRSIQMEMARKRMMQDVPKADVVITNPTHLAVAIAYESGMNAPKVLAKGAGEVAGKIREIARQNNVPVVENKPLARSLFRLVDIGREIPGDLYQAVAEVLAYIYNLKRKGKTARPLNR